VFLRDQPLFLRVKFYAAQTNAAGSYFGTWQIGTPGTDKVAYHNLNVAANSFSEFAISPALCDDKRNLRIRFVNRDSSALLFHLKTVWKCSIAKAVSV